MTTETMELPAEEAIAFLEASKVVVDEVVTLPIADMPLSLIVAMLDLRDACKALHEAMADARNR